MRWIARLCLFLLCGSLLAVPEYDAGIRELYTNNQPDRALPLFQAAAVKDPDNWAAVFMIGYVHLQYKHDAATALPYFQKSIELNRSNEPPPFEQTAAALRDLGRFDESLRMYAKAEKAYAGQGKTPPDYLHEGRAWTYFKNGDAEKAFAEAPDGSWLKNYIAPRTITIHWTLRFADAVAKWNLAEEQKLRITIPMDRPYQKIVSLSARPSDPSAKIRRLNGKDNRFLEVTRNGEWPETIQIDLVLSQNFRSMVRRPAGSQTTQGSALWAYASENGGGYYSLEDPRFTDLVNRVTASGRNTGEKIDLAMRYLRSHFKYDERIADANVYEILESGQGDCGYYSVVAIGMLRALHVPVRMVYGLNSGFNPPLPHAIIEIYDANTKSWYPHDPQSEDLYGIINPTYIAMTAFPPNGYAINRAADGLIDVDMMQFFWTGSGNDSLAVDIRSEGVQVAQRSMQQAPPPAGLPKSTAVPLPVRAGRSK